MSISKKIIDANSQPSEGNAIIGIGGARALTSSDALSSDHVLSVDASGQLISDINNSLDTRLFRGKGLVGLYPDSVAAYSLRSLRGVGGGQNVVRLRRASDSAEKDFSANDIVAGTYLSDELNPDPNFANAAEWSVGTGWTVSGGTANLVSVTGSSNFLTSVAAASEDSYRYYKVTFTIDSMSSNATVGLVMAGTVYREFDEYQITGPGTYTVIVDREIRNLVLRARFFCLSANPSGQTLQLSYLSFRGYQPSASELWSLNGLSNTFTYSRQETQSAYITTWYDQSFGQNDAIQGTASAQPLLIRAGVTNTLNGKPSLNFTESHKLTEMPAGYATEDIFIVSSSTDTQNVFFSNANGGSNYGWTSQSGSSSSRHSGWGSPTLYTQGVEQSPSNRGDVYDLLSTGNQLLISTAGADSSAWTTRQLSGYSSFEWSGEMQEFIIYPSDQSANRTNIETNINNYYSIY